MFFVSQTNGTRDTEADKWLRRQIARELSEDTEGKVLMNESLM